MGNPKRTVVVSLLLMLVVGIVQELTQGNPGSGLRRFAGVFFLAMFLAVLAEIWPEMAAALAVLTAVATILAYEEFFNAIQRVTGGGTRTIGTASASR